MPANWCVSCCDDFWALIGYRAAYVTLGYIIRPILTLTPETSSDWVVSQLRSPLEKTHG